MKSMKKKHFTILTLTLTLTLIIIAISGCAGLQISDQTTRSLATNIGYAAYRLVPQAQIPLSAICSLTSITDSKELYTQLNAQLKNIWVATNSNTSANSETAMIILGINNLSGTLETYVSNMGYFKVYTYLKAAVLGICDGVALAKT